MIVLEQSPANAFLREYGRGWEKPNAILVVSAHYKAPGPAIVASAAPPTIHDFGGFPEALYRLRYPAPGAPALAARAHDLLAAAGFSPRLDAAHGYDHGVWTPLILMAPEADIPVLAVSIDPRQSPAWHYEMGRALAPLRDDGVLIIGSGAATHNLFFRMRPPLGVEAAVERFRAWLETAVREGRVDDLLHYRDRAPFAVAHHPTEDHILPLFAALGAGDGAGRRIHASVDGGVIAMDTFAFDQAA